MQYFTVSIGFFFLFHSCVNLSEQWPQAHNEYLNDLKWKASLNSREQVHVRISREKPVVNDGKLHHHHRQRRQTISPEDQLENIAEEIFGMAKKAAITIIVLVLLCLICCVVTTVYICVRCCCSTGGNSRQKRNDQMRTIQIPQPVFIQSNPSPNYPPQTFQQQQYAAAAASTSIPLPEAYPMLPRPSAPPQPTDDIMIDRPPPYEQICVKN